MHLFSDDCEPDITTTIPTVLAVSAADPTSKKGVWSDFDESTASLSGDRTTNSACIVEKESYLKEPLLPRMTKDGRWTDPLNWWKQRILFYPQLQQVMRRRLCIMATSVPSERLFSKAGQLVTERRTRLSGWKISKIMFVHANMDKF